MNKQGHCIIAMALFLCASMNSYGQSAKVFSTSQIIAEASQNITNFKYVNVNGEKDKDYESALSGGFALGYQHNYHNGTFLTAKVGLRRAGANYVFNEFNYQWELTYSEYRIGFGYQYDFGKFVPHLSVQADAAYLHKATQQTHDGHYDLLAGNTFYRWDYGVFFSPGFSYYFYDNVAPYIDLNYMLGVRNIEVDDNQSTMNRLAGATVGIAISLK